MVNYESAIWIILFIINQIIKGNQPIRYRNYVLCLLYLGFGFRRSEALKVYLSDIDLNSQRPTITVRRRPDDPNDPRREEPRVKTLGRIVPLDSRTARILNDFILIHRRQFENYKKSPFLFLSSRGGKPLVARAINNMVEQVIQRHPEFKGHLTVHVLRHTYNDMLSERTNALSLSGADEKHVRNHLNGWNPQSDQGDEYRQRHIRERAFEISLTHQQALFEDVPT